MADITFKTGDSLYWKCKYVDSLGVGIDITDYIIRCQAKLDPTSGESTFDLTTINGGIIITNALTGDYLIRQYDTTSYPVSEYQCDIEFTAPSGFVRSTETFILEITQDITR